jgi:Bacterial protein of unknown function (DUF916)
LLTSSTRSLRFARVLAGALVALGGISSSAAAASASSVVKSGGAPLLGGFSARALGADGEVTPKTYFELEMEPGESFDGRILVTNAAGGFTRLRVDSVDGLTGQTSGTVYANRTDPREETSRWIRPAKEALRLDGRSSRSLAFHVHVPDDATPGDHVGAVAFQRILNPKKDGGFSVRQVLRVAVAVQIKVAGPAEARLELGAISLKALGGTQIPAVNVELKNTGALLCRPSLTVTLASDGEKRGTVNRQLDTILAGDTIDYPLPWPKPLQAGTYDVTAATTGCGQPAQTKATVELASALRGSTNSPGLDASMLEDEGSGTPWWAVALGVLGALGLGFFLARRTGRKDDQPAAAAAVAAASASAASESHGAPAPDVPQPVAKAVAIEPEPAPPAAG